ncbi:unnamed protein product [Blepharisma stoltei]|uniref:Uncharacterized protein n=1 Tax=Blepharisma stoltei TaxID=1481888 RepID=A0AAU9IQ31_9CILI|nr:unnamed protein product [Blepharisma stoltei]
MSEAKHPLRSSLPSLQSSQHERDEEELRNIIYDLDQSILVNKNLLKDVVSTLVPQKSKEHSNDTQVTHLISSKIHDKLLVENSRILQAIERIKLEIETANSNIQSFEEKSAQSRNRRKEYQKRIQEEAKKMRQTLHNKEDEIQRLEEYRSRIDEDIEESQQEEQVTPDKIIEEGKKLVNKLSKQLKQAEEQRDIEVRKCKDFEEDIKKIQGLVKVAMPAGIDMTNETLKKDYGLGLNYENYWFDCEMGGESIDTIQSSNLTIEDNIFPNKVDFASKNKHYLPKLNLSVVSQGASPERKQSPRVELSKLELALQIKCEEINSLQRILSHLEAQEYYLSKVTNKTDIKL